MRLNHNPTERDDGFPEAIYNFRIQSVDPDWQSRAGNKGVALGCEFYRASGGSFTRNEYIVTSLPKVKWRLEQFLTSIGLDYYDENLDTNQFLGKIGQALMHRQPMKENGVPLLDGKGSPIKEKYLSVDVWLEASEEDLPFSSPDSHTKLEAHSFGPSAPHSSQQEANDAEAHVPF